MMDGQRRQPGTGAPTEHPDQSPSLRRRRSWGPSNWTPARSSFAPVRRPDAPRDRRFAPTEHLAPEAVAAFVDGELGMTAHMRATHHLAMCPECVAAVDAQASARTRLRASGRMSIPTGLLGQLSQIPTREFDMTAQRGPNGPAPAPHGGETTPIPAPEMTRGRIQRWRGR